MGGMRTVLGLEHKVVNLGDMEGHSTHPALEVKVTFVSLGTTSRCVAQPGLEPATLLSQPPSRWDYSCATTPSCS